MDLAVVVEVVAEVVVVVVLTGYLSDLCLVFTLVHISTENFTSGFIVFFFWVTICFYLTQ